MSDEIETIDKNPKSWAVWKREAERLQAIIDDMALAAMDSEPVAYGLIFRTQSMFLNNFINTNTVFATREKAEVYGKGGSYEERSDGGLEWVPNAALDPVVIPLYRHAQPESVMVGEIDFIDHFERIIGERDDDIDICQPGSANYDALMLAALDAFRSAMLNGGKS